MRFTDLMEGSTIPKRLYHGTSLVCLLSILGENVMRDDLGGDDFHSGVSLTTSVGVAKHFAVLAQDYANQDLPEVNDSISGAIIVLDGQAVENSSSLIPVAWDGVTAERERRTRGPIPDIRSKIISIQVNKNDVAWMADLMSRYPEDFDDHQRAGLDALRSMSLKPIRAW